MTKETAQLRSDLAATRDRMSADIHELRNRAKTRLDVTRVVREHPWSALGAAVAVGALIGGTGADEKAVSATRDAISGATKKLGSGSHRDETPLRVGEEHEKKSGIADRFVGMLSATVASTLDRVIDDVRVASREWGARMSTSRPPATRATAPVAAAVVAAVGEKVVTNRAVDAVPVPGEMAPAELGLRADAVEAVGGGTHEPPLEPGAGELGARWS